MGQNVFVTPGIRWPGPMVPEKNEDMGIMNDIIYIIYIYVYIYIYVCVYIYIYIYIYIHRDYMAILCGFCRIRMGGD